MSWAIRPGPEHDHIDGRTHVHRVHLFNQVTGGEHNVELLLGSPVCRECRRPFEQDGVSGLDPAAEINSVLSVLQHNHNRILDYAGNHGVPIKLGPLATVIPQGHRVTNHGEQKMLHAPKTIIRTSDLK